MLAYKVGNAESGDVFTVRMDPNDFSLSVFKSSLSTFSGIAPNDQILLIGPPFKRLDSQFSPEMQDDAQQIFLYNRRFFADSTPGPTEVKLKPYEISEPVSADAPLSVSLTESLSPILRVIPDYERQYLAHIRRGEGLLAASELCHSSCKRCVEQMTVQLSSLEGAVGNLSDHYLSTQASFQSAQAKLNAQQKSHRSLLDNFEKTLERLQRVPLHPALQAIAQSNAGEPTRYTWLLDTVPVEKEYAWVDKCRQAHQKVEENMVQLQLVFDKVTGALRDVDSNPSHSVDMASLSQTVLWMEGEVGAQRQGMKDLRDSYHAMTDRISSILEKVPSGSMMDSASSIMDDVADAESTDLVKALASGSRKQDSEVMQPMEERCARMMERKGEVEQAKNRLAEEVYRVMRQVAVIQTDIQFKLKKGMDLMKKWRHGHNGYFQHLERMQSLPEAYRDFLLEVIRRNQYTADFEELVQESVEKIKRFRDRETERRANFMTTCGSNLSPFFFDSVPSLIEKPPYFNATVTERQQLPEIALADVAALQEIGVYSADEAVVSKIRSSGSLTSSMSSGGIPADESSAIDTARSQDDTVSKPCAGDGDKLQQLERENRQLRRLLAAQQQGSEAVVETVPANPVGVILADLSRDVAEILQGIVTPEVASDVTPMELGALKVGNASEMQKSVDFRLSEAIHTIERLNAIVRKAQTGFDAHLTSLQLPLTEDIEPLTSFRDVASVESAHITSASATSTILATPSAHPPVTDQAAPKISFLTFDVGDLALFLPTNKPDVFLAFSHAKCPNRYLSQDSLVNFKSAGKSTPGYILGKIVFIETRVASNADSHSGIGPEGSPLRLQEGTEYHLLEVEHVSFGSSSRSAARKKSSKIAGGDTAAAVGTKWKK